MDDGTIEEDNEDANQDADGLDKRNDNSEEREDHEDDRIMVYVIVDVDWKFCMRMGGTQAKLSII